MKKYVVPITVLVILFNFIFLNQNYSCYGFSGWGLENGGSPTEGTISDMSNNGTADLNGESVSITNIGTSVLGLISGMIAKMINTIPILFQLGASIIFSYCGVVKEFKFDSSTSIPLISIQNIIVGRYVLLDANIFRDVTSSGVVESFSDDFWTPIKSMRSNSQLWFIIIRDIALAVNLVMLLYVAIRLAVSTVARDQARYKELLYNWVVSMVLLFTIQYILAAISFGSDVLTKISFNFMKNLSDNGTKSFEYTIEHNILGLLSEVGGMQLLYYSIVYWILIWNTFKFVSLYLKRMFKSFFLVIISPLITVTYAMDKIADKQAQAFRHLINEYMITQFLQPLHCWTYMVFMFMANEIAIQSPLLGIVFLTALTKAEKIIKSLIGMTGISMNNVADEFSMKKLGGKMKGLVPKGGGKGAE